MAEYIFPSMLSEPKDEQMSLIPDTTYLKFVQFHEENPNVYARLRELAFEWKNAGHEKIGIAML